MIPIEVPADDSFLRLFRSSLQNESTTDKAAALLKDPSLGNRITTLLADEDGASLVECALIVALIAVVCVGTVAAVGTAAEGRLTDVAIGL